MNLAQKILARFKDIDSPKVVVSAENKEDLEKFLSLIGKLKVDQKITEGSQFFKLKGDLIRLDTSHGYKGQLHIHFPGGAVNQDGTPHDGFHGRIKNKIADFARSKGFNIPQNNMVESYLLEFIPNYFTEIVFSNSELRSN